MKSNTAIKLGTCTLVLLTILFSPSISEGQIIFRQFQDPIFRTAFQLGVNATFDSPAVIKEAKVSSRGNGPAPTLQFYKLNTDGVQSKAKFDGTKLTIFSDGVPYNYRRSAKYDSRDGIFLGFTNQALTRAIRFPVDGGGTMQVAGPDDSWIESKTKVVKVVAVDGPPLGTFTNTEEFALQLQSAANDLLLDMHFNYSHNRQFAATYQKTYTLLEAAQRVRKAAQTNRREEINPTLKDLDGLAYRLQADIRNWNCRPKYRCGKGSLNQKLSTVQWSLADLMHNVGVDPKELAFLSGRNLEAPPITVAPRPR